MTLIRRVYLILRSEHIWFHIGGFSHGGNHQESDEGLKIIRGSPSEAVSDPGMTRLFNLT